MISATTISSTFARFANNLPNLSFDLSRFVRSHSIQNEPLKNAYMQFATTYDHWVDERLDEEFLSNAGAGIIDAFTQGEMDRHDAARALVHAWNEQLNPVRSTVGKRQIRDATVAADSLLSWLDAEINGMPLVVEAPVNRPVERAPEAVIEESLILDIHVEETQDAAVTIIAGGTLDRKSYHQFLMEAQRLYQQGVRTLSLDLTNVTKVDLSGIYALHATAKIFRGERYPRYEYGYAGLRFMVDENKQAGPHEHIRLTAISGQARGTLEESGVAELFSLS